MEAYFIEQLGAGPQGLVKRQTEVPSIKDNEVLVKVKALGINPVDKKVLDNGGVLSFISGVGEDDLPVISGWDIAGTVTEIGSAVTNLSVGDDVFGMVNFPGVGRCYAEFVAADVNHLAKKPSALSFEEAAAGTLAALTALQSLQGYINANDRVLIHAGSGGVGHYAIQIAKHFGAHVIATSSAKNKDFVLGLGADEHIDYRSVNFGDVLSDIDYVLECIGEENLLSSIKVTKKGGKIICLLAHAATDEAKDLAERSGVDLSVYLVKSDANDMETIKGLFEQGVLRSHIDKQFDFNDLIGALEYIGSGRTVGKIVVSF